jgi:aarF domain-containing kinase
MKSYVLYFDLYFFYDKDGEEYNKIIKECHQRSADKLVKACILNGGMYVKMGQGLSTMNQILPKEFYVTLRSLQSEALRSTGNDVKYDLLL